MTALKSAAAAAVMAALLASAPVLAEDDAPETLDAQELVDELDDDPVCVAAQNEGITADIINCTGKKTEAAERALNFNYKAAMKALDDAGKKELKAFQLQWVKDRKKYSDQQALLAWGGSMSSIFVSSAFLDWTIDRAAQLAAIAEEPEAPAVVR